MASVIKRTWTSRGPTGHRVKKVAWGYTAQINGKQERKFSADWTKDQAGDALAARILERDTAAAPPPPKTFGQLAEDYLAFKRAKGKRSVAEDERHLGHLIAAFGQDTPVNAITAQRIAQHDRDRATAISTRLKRPVTPATINRELALLRHMLRLAEEWGYIARAPRIRLGKEPEGRIRWLEVDEERRLLGACRTSQNRQLAAIVTIAIETGMRAGEIMGLTWERVDLSRGVFRLERTKSGRRREVPMRQGVYDLLATLPGHREGRLWREGRIRTAFENAVGTAKLDDFTFHDCRHHFASWFMMRGGSLQALREILGHRDIKLTLRYAHLSPGHLRTEIEKTAAPMPVPTAPVLAHGQHKVVESSSLRT
jgi:integrase